MKSIHHAGFLDQACCQLYRPRMRRSDKDTKGAPQSPRQRHPSQQPRGLANSGTLTAPDAEDVGAAGGFAFRRTSQSLSMGIRVLKVLWSWDSHG